MDPRAWNANQLDRHQTSRRRHNPSQRPAAEGMAALCTAQIALRAPGADAQTLLVQDLDRFVGTPDEAALQVTCSAPSPPRSSVEFRKNAWIEVHALPENCAMCTKVTVELEATGDVGRALHTGSPEQITANYGARSPQVDPGYPYQTAVEITVRSAKGDYVVLTHIDENSRARCASGRKVDAFPYTAKATAEKYLLLLTVRSDVHTEDQIVRCFFVNGGYASTATAEQARAAQAYSA